MLKILPLALALIAATPLRAATQIYSIDLAFQREFFQHGFDYQSLSTLDMVYDGASYGFEGTFSNLELGDSVGAVIEIEEGPDEMFSTVSCYFAGIECQGEFTQISDDGLLVSIASFYAPSIWFDFASSAATYYEDGPGGKSDMGFYNFYGAEFSIVSAAVTTEFPEVPAPMPAALLLTGLGIFGLARRIRSNRKR